MSRIWIFTHLPDSPSVPILEHAARLKGLTVETIDCTKICEAELVTRLMDCPPHVVIPRLGSSCREEDLALLETIEQHSIPVVNRAANIRVARNKAEAHRVFADHGVRSPRTKIIDSTDQIDSALSDLGDGPWVLKAPLGRGGDEVFLVDTIESCRQQLASVLENSNEALLQEFVEEARGQDTRVLVVGGHAVTAMCRTAESSDFRSNLHLGGQASPRKLDAQLIGIAEHAAKAFQLGMAGIDILESGQNAFVIEVNASPGLKGTQSVSHGDVGESVINFAVQICKTD